MKQILWDCLRKLSLHTCAHCKSRLQSSGRLFRSTLFWRCVLLFRFLWWFSQAIQISLLVTARILGIELLQNFHSPFFARHWWSFGDAGIFRLPWFLRLSLHSFDGSRNGMLRAIRNTMIIFLISVLACGANWTFIVWGLLNAIYISAFTCFKEKQTFHSILLLKEEHGLIQELSGMLIPFLSLFFCLDLFPLQKPFKPVEHDRGKYFSVSFTNWIHYRERDSPNPHI